MISMHCFPFCCLSTLNFLKIIINVQKIVPTVDVLFLNFTQRNIVYRYMQAVVDEIVFANADPLKVL